MSHISAVPFCRLCHSFNQDKGSVRDHPSAQDSGAPFPNDAVPRRCRRYALRPHGRRLPGNRCGSNLSLQRTVQDRGGDRHGWSSRKPSKGRPDSSRTQCDPALVSAGFGPAPHMTDASRDSSFYNLVGAQTAASSGQYREEITVLSNLFFDPVVPSGGYSDNGSNTATAIGTVVSLHRSTKSRSMN